MQVNNRTITVLVIVAVILVGALVADKVGEARSTKRYLEDLAGQDPSKVMDAMVELGGRKGAVRGRLIELLQSPDPEGASRAALLLGSSPNEAAAQALLGALNNEAPAVRIAALQALGRMAYEPAAAQISAILGNKTESPEIRVSAAYALGMIGGAGCVEPLAQVLAEVPPPPPGDDAEAEPPPPDTALNVRLAAARALGQSRQGAAAEALGNTLKPEAEPSPEVRLAAAYALGDVGGSGAEHASRETAVRGLLNGAQDESGDVRVASLHSLGRLTVPEVLQAQVGQVVLAALNDDHYWARIAAERTKSLLRITQ
jgi:HEAT repeat protein